MQLLGSYGEKKIIRVGLALNWVLQIWAWTVSKVTPKKINSEKKKNNNNKIKPTKMEHSTSHSLAARYCVWTLAQSPIGSKSRLTHNTQHKAYSAFCRCTCTHAKITTHHVWKVHVMAVIRCVVDTATQLFFFFYWRVERHRVYLFIFFSLPNLTRAMQALQIFSIFFFHNLLK